MRAGAINVVQDNKRPSIKLAVKRYVYMLYVGRAIQIDVKLDLGLEALTQEV